MLHARKTTEAHKDLMPATAKRSGGAKELRSPRGTTVRNSSDYRVNAQSTFGNQAVLRAIRNSTTEVQSAPRGIRFVGETGGSGSGSGSAAPPAPAPRPAAPAPPAPANTIDKIDFIDSPQGALGGFQKVNEGDLNVPGPFDSARAISHPLQVHFHLDQGNSANVSPRRQIKQTASGAGRIVKRPPDKPSPTGGAPTPGGFEGTATEPDGPPAHEVKRPSNDRIVVADAPGILISPGAQPYPIVIKDDFILTIADHGRDIAQATYQVGIVKQSATDANKINVLIPDQKKDLVRGKDL